MLTIWLWTIAGKEDYTSAIFWRIYQIFNNLNIFENLSSGMMVNAWVDRREERGVKGLWEDVSAHLWQRRASAFLRPDFNWKSKKNLMKKGSRNFLTHSLATHHCMTFCIRWNIKNTSLFNACFFRFTFAFTTHIHPHCWHKHTELRCLENAWARSLRSPPDESHRVC